MVHLIIIMQVYALCTKHLAHIVHDLLHQSIWCCCLLSASSCLPQYSTTCQFASRQSSTTLDAHKTYSATSPSCAWCVTRLCNRQILAQIAVEANGSIPPGNAPGAQQQWVRKAPRVKPELKLTPGKGIEDLTCSIEDLLDSVVKSNKVEQRGLLHEPESILARRSCQPTPDLACACCCMHAAW